MTSPSDPTPRLALWILDLGNFFGAVVSFFCFRFVDHAADEVPGVGVVQIACALLVLIGYGLGRRWTAPLRYS